MHGSIDVLGGRLERPRLASLLAARWDRYVVSVVAGAGFGKSTAIAQVAGTDAASGRHDHVVSCDPSCSTESELVRRVARAFGMPAHDVATLARQITALAGEHCLVLDDVHRIEPDTSGAAALSDLVERLLPTVHVMAASRRPLPLRLARWRAAGLVLDVGEDTLAFTADEVAALAARRGVPANELDETNGWPALVTLSALAGRRGAIEYLAEEVIEQLAPKLADTLDVALLAGSASPELLERATGSTIDTAEFARAVPMVAIDDRGVVTPHDLWATVVEPRMLPERRRHLLAEIAHFWRDAGDFRSALRAATRANDAFALADVVRDVGRLGHIALELDEIDHWVARAPDAFAATAEGRLLAAISARDHDQFADATRDRLVAAWQELRELGVVGCEVVAMSELAFVHRLRGEPEQMMPIVVRLLELDAAGHPECRALATFAKAGIAEQLGDAEAALAALDSLHEGDLSDGWMALVEFQRCNHLLLLGRPREALEAARRSTRLGSAGYLGGYGAELSAQWCLGVTRDVLDRLPIADELPHSSQVDRIWTGTWSAAMLASAGRLTEAARNIAAARAALRSHSQPEFVGFLARAEATYAVAEHDTARAHQKLTEYLHQYPLDGPMGLRLANRAPALVAVLLGDDVRALLRGRLPGVWQQQMLDAADALADVRAGRAPCRIPDPPMVMCALPLPWAVELAVLGAGLGCPAAVALAQHLTAVAGDAVTTELTALGAGPSVSAMFHADQASGEVTVTVLGEVGVTGPGLTGTDELRRRRVRELLAAIALDGPVHRDALAERLWPGLDPERSTANLRVTLTYLRRLRADGIPVVVEDAGGLRLAEHIGTDQRALVRLGAEADTARRAGASGAALDSYMRALALVSGPPLTGTVAEQWFHDRADQLRLGLAALGVRAARLATELGDHRRAATAAGAAIEADPYNEEAHRLAVSALLELEQPAAAEQAAARAVAQLGELGIELEPATHGVFARAAVPSRPLG